MDHAILILLSYLRNDGILNTGDFAARLCSWCEQGLRCLDRLPLGLGRTVGSVRHWKKKKYRKNAPKPVCLIDHD
jgi:hypothetical protein